MSFQSNKSPIMFSCNLLNDFYENYSDNPIKRKSTEKVILKFNNANYTGLVGGRIGQISLLQLICLDKDHIDNYFELFDFLVSSGLDINVIDNKKKTLLEYAICDINLFNIVINHPKFTNDQKLLANIMQTLPRNKASVCICDILSSKGIPINTVFLLSYGLYGDFDVAYRLLQTFNVNINHITTKRNNLLFGLLNIMAGKDENGKKIKISPDDPVRDYAPILFNILNDPQLQINVLNRENRNILWYLVELKDITLGKSLIDLAIQKNINIHQKDIHGQNIIFNCPDSYLSYLLDKECDINILNKHNKTALEYILLDKRDITKKLEYITLFTTKGFDLNKQDDKKNTISHRMILNEWHVITYKIARKDLMLLLSAFETLKANFNLKNSQNSTVHGLITLLKLNK